MPKMTNKRLIALSQKIPELRQEEKAINKEIARLQKRLEELDVEITLASRVSDVIKGVPVWVSDIMGTSVSPVLSDSLTEADRRAKVWLNRHNDKTWRVGISGPGTRFLFTEETVGDWPTKKAALEAAKHWVALGERPVSPLVLN